MTHTQAKMPVRSALRALQSALRYYGELYLSYLSIFLKRQLQYRADFGVMLVTTGIREGMTLLFIGVIFSRMERLVGWSFAEVLLIYGLLTTGRAFCTLLLDMPYAVGGYVRSGRLDLLLIRPLPPLFQLTGERGFNTTMVGSVAIGIGVILYALTRPEIRPQPWWALYLPLVVASGALLISSIVLIVACLAFRFTSVQAIIYPVNWFADYGQYPTAIFASPVQFVLTWILPYAMAGFYPTAFLLRGDEYQIYGLLAPLMGIIFSGLALTVWHYASRYYQSTGT
jgi:ABC-2 type transport system permease protein